MPIINISPQKSNEGEFQHIESILEEKAQESTLAQVKADVAAVKGDTAAISGKASNLDAAVSSRAPAGTALSNAVWTNGRAGLLDRIQATLNTPNGDTLGNWLNAINNSAGAASSNAGAANSNASLAASRTEYAGNRRRIGQRWPMTMRRPLRILPGPV